MGFHGDFMGFHVQNPWLMMNFGDYTMKNNSNHPRTGTRIKWNYRGILNTGHVVKSLVKVPEVKISTSFDLKIYCPM